MANTIILLTSNKNEIFYRVINLAEFCFHETKGQQPSLNCLKTILTQWFCNKWIDNDNSYINCVKSFSYNLKVTILFKKCFTNNFLFLCKLSTILVVQNHSYENWMWQVTQEWFYEQLAEKSFQKYSYLNCDGNNISCTFYHSYIIVAQNFCHKLYKTICT